MNILLKIKHAYQRVVRGYDDTAYWSLSYYLAPIIRDVTLNMAENHVCHPIELTDKEWEKILRQISFGFGSYIEMDWYLDDIEEYKRLEEDLKVALKLFSKYYINLWD